MMSGQHLWLSCHTRTIKGPILTRRRPVVSTTRKICTSQDTNPPIRDITDLFITFFNTSKVTQLCLNILRGAASPLTHGFLGFQPQISFLQTSLSIRLSSPQVNIPTITENLISLTLFKARLWVVSPPIQHQQTPRPLTKLLLRLPAQLEGEDAMGPTRQGPSTPPPSMRQWRGA